MSKVNLVKTLMCLLLCNLLCSACQTSEDEAVSADLFQITASDVFEINYGKNDRSNDKNKTHEIYFELYYMTQNLEKVTIKLDANDFQVISQNELMVIEKDSFDSIQGSKQVSYELKPILEESISSGRIQAVIEGLLTTSGESKTVTVKDTYFYYMYQDLIFWSRTSENDARRKCAQYLYETGSITETEFKEMDKY